MNEQTLKLIEGLAQKLGTTSEYLWGILIKQALVDSVIRIGYILFLICCGLVLWKVHKKLLEKPAGDSYDTYYEQGNHTPALIMVIMGIVWLICSVVALSFICKIFTGFYNPEYFALDKILSSIKPSN